MRTLICTLVLLCASTALAADQPAAAASAPAGAYAVWAYKMTDGQWVKDDQYSWTTPDPAAAWDYAQKVNAVAGWSATTNSPAPQPVPQRYGFGRGFRGVPITFGGNGSITFNGRTVNLPGPYSNLIQQALQNGNWAVNSGDDSDNSVYDNSEEINDAINLQNSQALQDQINNQIQNDNTQEMLNEQNFENTENMINSQNEANNAQMMNNP